MSTISNDEIIPPDKIREGVIRALNNSRALFSSSKELFNQKKYQTSIPLAILSYEESFKANYLMNILEEKRGIRKQEWKSILDHNFKLTQSDKDIIERLKQTSDEVNKINKEFVNKIIPEYPSVDIDTEIRVREYNIKFQKRFQIIKEVCLYLDWNLKEKTWNYFQKIPEDAKKAINFFIVNTAEQNLLNMMYLLDIHDKPLQSSGYKLVPGEQENTWYKIEDYSKDTMKRESVQRIRDFQKRYSKNSDEMVKGLWMINKYFDGDGNDSLMDSLNDLMSKGFKFNSI